jgi:hypothetical protein
VFPHLQASALRNAYFNNYAICSCKLLEMPVINLKVVRPLVDDFAAVVVEVFFQRVLGWVHIEFDLNF